MTLLKQILLLEDDEIEAMKVKRALNHLGCSANIVLCNNGLEGLNWLSENKEDLPSIILLDLNMPKMNGLEFLKIIKEDNSLKVIPVIVLTTSNNKADKEQSFEESVAGYMVKPIRYTDYLETMKTIQHYWQTSELAHC